MAWIDLLKALPDPVSLPGFLGSEQGLDYLIGEAEGDDKKNLIRSRDQTKRLAEGEDIPEGLDKESIQKNAEVLLEKLNEIITEQNKGSQTNMEDRVESIIENKDKDALISFVGTKPVRSWSGKTRTRKINLLNENRKAILDFIDMEDTDLFYFDTSEFALTATKPIKDENWDEKIERLRADLEGTSVTVSGDENVTIEFEKTTSWPDMKKILDSTHMRISGRGKSKATDKDALLLFEKQGSFSKSPLLELYVKGETPKNVKDKVREAELEKYETTVTTGENALEYLNCIAYKGLRKDRMFMPVPKINQGATKTINNAKIQLLGSAMRPKVSASLAAVLKGSSFNLSDLVREGVVQTETRFIPDKVRNILEGKPKATGDLTERDIQDLQEIYNASRKEMAVFVKRLKGNDKENFKKLTEGLQGQVTNLFSSEEKEMLMGLAGKNPKTIVRELEEYYKVKPSTSTARKLERALRSANPFVEVESSFKFDHNKIPGMKFNDLKDLVYELKILRQKDESQGEKIEMDLKDSLKSYTKGFKVSNKINANAPDMLYFLYNIDLYYGRTPFKSEARKFKRGEIDIDALIESANTNYTKIIQGLVDQVKEKIDDILLNKETYQNALVIDDGSKSRKLFEILESKNLIKSISRTEV